MNATAAPERDIESQARDWALAVFGERLSPDRAESLRQWLDADPRHARAYDDAEQLMLALPGVEALSKAATKSPSRVWIWAAALPLAACLAIGVGLAVRPTVLESRRAVRTVALRDGSTAILAPETRLREAGWLSGRRYTLERGEALFDVRHVDGRPFGVQAGDASITVLGTRFDVRKADSGEIGVAVQRGRVAVRRETGGPPIDTILARGDGITLDRSGARRVELADVSTIDDWRRGRLSYASTRISDVAADISRFSNVRVAADPAVAQVRLTASFRADQAGAFVASLPALLPVEVRTRDDGSLLIAPRNVRTGE